ncbi:hypothetical protein C8R46DRAFT_1228382 [Mycena filopes]|nr:hypothetical protein C8R46DRAFT_1228382 [Mycena filopes]
MPEPRETSTSGKIAQLGLERAQAEGCDLTVQAIVADLSAQEAALPGAPEAAQKGHPVALGPDSTVVRGSLNHQAPLYPPQLVPSETTPNPPSLTSLTLRGVESTHRALILNLGALCLMVQYLTHCSVQWYTRAQWDGAIMVVEKRTRAFRIGVALVFADYVLAFVTIDLLFQPTWVTDRSAISIPPNLYTSPSEFLQTLAAWIQSEKLLSRSKPTLACNSIRTANQVWYGIGVYTVMELFFMAGLSPFLTVSEVFGCPSRTARLVAAFWTYIHETETNVWALVQPCLFGGLLAPTREQRLRYADWLYVFAKDRVYMSTRMANLVDDFHDILSDFSDTDVVHCRATVENLFDVFEPTLIAPALRAHPNLGPLIFGHESWLRLGGSLVTTNADPLTALYAGHDLLSAPTKLSPDYYVPLFLPSPEAELKKAWRKTRTYQAPKEMWSITANFPATLHWSGVISKNQNDTTTKVTTIVGKARDLMLFKTIVLSSGGVSIGPLEYCGNGHIVHVGNVPHVAVCKGDPTIPLFFEERALRGLHRITAKLDAPGQRKRAKTAKENKDLQKKLDLIKPGYKRALKDEEKDQDCEPPKPKRRRLSADQKLANGN